MRRSRPIVALTRRAEDRIIVRRVTKYQQQHGSPHPVCRIKCWLPEVNNSATRVAVNKSIYTDQKSHPEVQPP